MRILPLAACSLLACDVNPTSTGPTPPRPLVAAPPPLIDATFPIPEEESEDTDQPPPPPAPQPKLRPYTGSLAIEAAAWTILDGATPDEHFGASVVSAGDTNGDGKGDFLVASECERRDATKTCVKVIQTFLGPVRRGRWSAANRAVWKYDYQASNIDMFGFDRLRPIGDITGDGVVDVTFDERVLTGPFHTERGYGLIYVGNFETTLGIPDVTGDGKPDLLASSLDQTRVYLFAGPITARPSLDRAWATFEGPPGSGFGVTLGGGRFFRTDIGDVVMAAPDDGDQAGSTYVFSGPIARGGYGWADADATLSGEASERSGCRIDAGNLRADRRDDLLVGGEVVTIAEIASGVERLASMESRLPLGNSDDLPGARIIGDLDGDGHADLLVPNASERSIDLYYGPIEHFGQPSARFVLPGPTPIRERSLDLAALGDLDGDRLADVAISDATDRGHVYIVRGSRPIPD